MGDATIQLLLKNQAGRAVTWTSIAVNKPVEVLYAVDGTWTTAADNANVRQFEQRFQGVEGTDKFYFAGPKEWYNGSDSPGIVTLAWIPMQKKGPNRSPIRLSMFESDGC